MEKLDRREGVRSALCMLPMAVAYASGHPDVGIPLGQAGFLMAALPLPMSRMQRVVNGIVFLTFGLGLYLIGGVVVAHYWTAMLFTFAVSMALSLMSGWRLASLLAFTFFSVYAAGLNVSDPTKLPNNFFAFSVAITWVTALSLLPWWRGHDFSRTKLLDELSRIKTGIRMGIGTSIAYAIASFFDYSRMGWAPSATANIIRFDKDVSMGRAKLRVLGTVFGALAVGAFFVLVPNPNHWAAGAFVLTCLNGLTNRINKWGYFPFYTSVILILYSLADPTTSAETTMQRVTYNIVGVLVAYVVSVYSFPYLFSWLDNRKFTQLLKTLKSPSE